MNLKISKKNATSGALAGGGAVVGVMTGRIAKSFTQILSSPVVQLGIGITGVVGGASIEGNSTGAKLAKGAMLGIGIDNLVQGISSFASPLLAAKATDSSTVAKIKSIGTKALMPSNAGMGNPELLAGDIDWGMENSYAELPNVGGFKSH